MMVRRGRGRYEPFQPGNTVRLTHGAYHEATIAPLARRLVTAAVEASPYLAADEYAAVLQAWGRAEAQVRLLDTYLAEHGPLDGKGKPRPAVDLLLRYEALAARHRDALGLSPLARAKLGRDVAAQQFDLARIWAHEAEQEADGIDAPPRAVEVHDDRSTPASEDVEP